MIKVKFKKDYKLQLLNDEEYTFLQGYTYFGEYENGGLVVWSGDRSVWLILEEEDMEWIEVR